ncbi:MAG: glycosyl hydrolase 53 family protein, partial [Armatimonadota bacterium]
MSVVAATLALTLALSQSKMTYVGGDPSEIPEVEAKGGVYKVNGKPVDPWVAMKEAGWTAVRLRVWNSPKDGYCDKAHTLATAKRIKAAGLKLMIDFHYSDYWADPGKQNKPAAWKDLKFDDLKKAVRDYSKDVIKGLDDQGT